MQRVAFWWQITTWRWWWRGARFPSDWHICPWHVLRSIGSRFLLWLVLRLTLWRCWRRRGWVIELNRRRWRWCHRGRRNVIRRRGICERGCVLFTAAALDVTRTAQLWSHKASIFFLIHTELIFIIFIVFIWESHLHNILTLTPSTYH